MLPILDFTTKKQIVLKGYTDLEKFLIQTGLFDEIIYCFLALHILHSDTGTIWLPLTTESILQKHFVNKIHKMKYINCFKSTRDARLDGFYCWFGLEMVQD